jgi:hypothetical protein
MGGELRLKNASPGTIVEVLIPATVASAQEALATA